MGTKKAKKSKKKKKGKKSKKRKVEKVKKSKRVGKLVFKKPAGYDSGSTSSSLSSGSDPDDDVAAVRQVTSGVKGTEARHGWMLPDVKLVEERATMSSRRQKEQAASAAKDAKEKEAADKEQRAQRAGGGLLDDNRTAAARQQDKPTLVGDGGASWRRRALKAAQSRAEDEGLDVDDVLGNTHGTVAEWKLADAKLKRENRKRWDVVRAQRRAEANQSRKRDKQRGRDNERNRYKDRRPDRGETEAPARNWRRRSPSRDRSSERSSDPTKDAFGRDRKDGPTANRGSAGGTSKHSPDNDRISQRLKQWGRGVKRDKERDHSNETSRPDERAPRRKRNNSQGSDSEGITRDRRKERNRERQVTRSRSAGRTSQTNKHDGRQADDDKNQTAKPGKDDLAKAIAATLGTSKKKVKSDEDLSAELAKRKAKVAKQKLKEEAAAKERQAQKNFLYGNRRKVVAKPAEPQVSKSAPAQKVDESNVTNDEDSVQQYLATAWPHMAKSDAAGSSGSPDVKVHDSTSAPKPSDADDPSEKVGEASFTKRTPPGFKPKSSVRAADDGLLPLPKGGDAANQAVSTATKTEAGARTGSDRTDAEILSELNRLSAKKLRANMLGKTSLEAKLDAKILALKALNPKDPAIQHPSQSQSDGVGSRGKERASGGGERLIGKDNVETVVMNDMTRDGRMRSINRGPPKTDQGPVASYAKRRKVNKIGEDGQRLGYFEDDVEEKQDLMSLLEAERLAEDDDHYDNNFAKSIMNSAKYKQMSLDEQFDAADNSMRNYESKRKKLPIHKRKDAEQKRMVREHQKAEQTLERCWHCLTSPKYQKHLTISIGVKMYLALPQVRIMTPGHCVLVPMEHTVSMATFDEDVYEEYNYWRKHLVKMFAKKKQGVIFIEQVKHLKARFHTTIQVIPLPMAQFSQAPMYFKKAIMESDAEWTQNKKLIDTRTKGFRRSVPSRFEYFCVEFGNEGGFAHVIEDHQIFPEHFGLEIVCGILEEPAQILLRAKRRGVTEERQRVRDFQSKWAKFDWTRKLAGGDMASTSKPTATKKTDKPNLEDMVSDRF